MDEVETLNKNFKDVKLEKRCVGEIRGELGWWKVGMITVALFTCVTFSKNK